MDKFQDSDLRQKCFHSNAGTLHKFHVIEGQNVRDQVVSDRTYKHG